MRSMLMLGTPISRARPNALVACAASVLRSSTARARGSNPCTPRLKRFTPPSSRLQLAAQMVGRLALVRDQLLDPLRHAVLDARDLMPDLPHVSVLAAIPLALAPEARVLVPQIGDRMSHLAVHAQAVPGLR